MESAIHFFTNLFDVSHWPARWYCGMWTDFHGWLYIGSDAMIWLAYFIIPVIIIYYIQRRSDIPFLPIFWLFGAFILLCGLTHLIDAVIFWWPAYRLSALLRFLTAIVSLVTVVMLIRELPKALALIPSLKGGESDELEKKNLEINQLRRELEVLKSQK